MDGFKGRRWMKRKFFFFFRTVSNFNILKTLTLLVHAMFFWCFHNPPNSNMDYRICNVITAYVIFLHSLIRRTFVESPQNLTPEKSDGGSKP